jgi:hypothetical protein
VVIATARADLLEVQFDGDRTELVRPDQLAPLQGFFDDNEGGCESPPIRRHPSLTLGHLEAGHVVLRGLVVVLAADATSGAVDAWLVER